MVALFETVACADGSHTLRDLASGQTMHSSVGALEEARSVYLEPTELKQRLLEGPVTLFDVGMGIAANALAAAECRLALGPDAAPLRIVSFENKIEGLAFALKQDEFTWLKPHSGRLGELLGRGSWRGDGVEWTLHCGDFAAALSDAPAADVIFYDFYTPALCRELWSREAFARLLAHSPQAQLATYSSATWVRANLLAAGFFVGVGGSTGAKRETTVASGDRSRVARPLDSGWLLRKSRSLERLGLLDAVRDHPLFNS